jgi:uncharacterized Zn ribbon protein
LLRGIFARPSSKDKNDTERGDGDDSIIDDLKKKGAFEPLKNNSFASSFTMVTNSGFSSSDASIKNKKAKIGVAKKTSANL